MKVERNAALPQQLGLQNQSKDPTQNNEPIDTRAHHSKNDAVEDIDSVVDKFSSKNPSSSTIYNRFKSTNVDKKNSEFVNATILKPGSYNPIDVSIYYEGLSKNDFRDVDVWKNTIGKTVYGINKTLQYVHDNSQTLLPEKIQFEEDYTIEGVKDDESFYKNLNKLADKLSEGKIDVEKMQETISPMIEKYS